jgi:hypothetical protein
MEVLRSDLPGQTFEGIKWQNDRVERVWETNWDVPTDVQHNSSLYLDIFMVYSIKNYKSNETGPATLHGGFNFDGSLGEYRPAEWVHTRKLLTRYMPQRKIRATKKLLSGGSSAEESLNVEEEEDSKLPLPVISYYHPNVSVELVCDSGALPYHTLPPAIKSNVQLAQQKADGKEWYLPPVYVNDFWLLKGVSPIVLGVLGFVSLMANFSDSQIANESDQLYYADASSSSHVQAYFTLQVPALCFHARLVRKAIEFSLSGWTRRRRRRK